MPIKEAVLQKTELGNDPADNRRQKDYLEAIDPKSVEDSWMSDFELTDDEIAELGDPEWIFPNLILKEHIIVIPARPNAGKTTLMLWVASQIASKIDVVYVNADVSGSDAKEMVLRARRDGFRMLVPDLKLGKSMDGVVEHLDAMNRTGTDYSGKLFIFDTLKKMTDVINKHKAKELFKLLRGLSAKGMTIVLLAHTNKHKGADGKDIFEGVGDLRADVDEMIYLESQKNADGSLTVSTVPDKVRGDFTPITFEVSPDREVTPSEEFIDVKKQNRERAQREKDQPYIEAIREAIASGCSCQQDVVKYCKASAYGAGKVREILLRYNDKEWYGSRVANNAWSYTLEHPQ